MKFHSENDNSVDKEQGRSIPCKGCGNKSHAPGKSMSRRDCSNFDMQCHDCEKQGHFKKVCKQPKKTNLQQVHRMLLIMMSFRHPNIGHLIKHGSKNFRLRRAYIFACQESVAGSTKWSGRGIIVKCRGKGKGNEKRTQTSQTQSYPGDSRDVNDRLPDKMRRWANELKNTRDTEDDFIRNTHWDNNKRRKH